MKRVMLAAGFVLAATSESWAQAYLYGAPYGYGTYDYAPGFGIYDYYAPSYSGYAVGGDAFAYDRVDGPGRGDSAESQR